MSHLRRTLSPRLAEIVDALPLQRGMWVLEIGCGPGAAAREIALERLGAVLAPDARLFIDGGDPLREIVVPPGQVSAPDAGPEA